VLESTVRMRRDLGERISPIRAAAVFALEDKILGRIERDADVLATSYERIRSEPEAEASRLCAALGLRYDAALLQVSFEQNTSFRRAGEREQVFSGLERLAIRATGAAMRVLPLELLTWLRDRLRSGQTRLVEGTFREITRRYGLE
jgi:hypothetical protein